LIPVHSCCQTFLKEHLRFAYDVAGSAIRF
jgi:hypothetical protein